MSKTTYFYIKKDLRLCHLQRTGETHGLIFEGCYDVVVLLEDG